MTLAPVVVALALVGCQHLGPNTISRDRSDYASSISDSWKRQTLLNIVKLRYLDPPIFVDVGQIVAGYSMETTVNAAGTFPETVNVGGNTATFGAAARYTDRPTITYTPLTGNRFVRSLMMPLPPESVFYTIQSGWPADGVLFATVASINGLKNQEIAAAGVSPPDPQFLRVLSLMRSLQLSGTVGMRVEADAKQQKTTLVTIRSTRDTPEAAEQSRELRQLLGLDPNAESFRLVFGGVAGNDKEVSVLTRSILHLMQAMASEVDVPREHAAQGRTARGSQGESGGPTTPRLVRIYSSTGQPRDAFVSVRYRDHWFFIDDRDLSAKRTFAFMMLLFTLADSGEKEAMPLITIPAQ